jgi:hypothetical protein
LPEDQVVRMVQQTNLNVFLTGKAGTGKTTLLRKICNTTWKRYAIVAPTGVAAIHAGGSTIHSFFNIFPHTFLPFGDIPNSRNGRFETAWSLSRNIKLKSERIKIIQNLDLLIIDEVSMVRCDLLDALDVVLRKYRHSNLPFGGLQLLLCGDLFQLPPVVKDAEAGYLNLHYPSFYFFESKALKQALNETARHLLPPPIGSLSTSDAGGGELPLPAPPAMTWPPSSTGAKTKGGSGGGATAATRVNRYPMAL